MLTDALDRHDRFFARLPKFLLLVSNQDLVVLSDNGRGFCFVAVKVFGKIDVKLRHFRLFFRWGLFFDFQFLMRLLVWGGVVVFFNVWTLPFLQIFLFTVRDAILWPLDCL